MPDFDLEPNLRLYSEEQGEVRPVVFLPGWTGSTRAFRYQLGLFARRHRAIALDYRGHGQSTQTQVGHSLAGYARDVHAFLVGHDLQGVVLVGHSMGAFVTWEYLSQVTLSHVIGMS